MNNATKITAMVVFVWIGFFGSLTLHFLNNKNACDQASVKFSDARNDGEIDMAATRMRDVCGKAGKEAEAFLNGLSSRN